MRRQANLEDVLERTSPIGLSLPLSMEDFGVK